MTGPAPGAAVAAPRSIRRYVLEDESIVLATRHHWARVVEPVATTLAAFVVVGFLVGVLRGGVGDGVEVLWWAWLAVLARAVVRLVGWRVEWFVATDKRMLLLTGLVTHRVAMMPLHKVTDMSYARSVVGRVLGYGEFVLESAGQDQAMRRISFMPHPDDSYRTLCATIFGPGGSVPGQGTTTARGASATLVPRVQAATDPGAPTGPAEPAVPGMPGMPGMPPSFPPVRVATYRFADPSQDPPAITQSIPVVRRSDPPAEPSPGAH